VRALCGRSFLRGFASVGSVLVVLVVVPGGPCARRRGRRRWCTGHRRAVAQWQRGRPHGVLTRTGHVGAGRVLLPRGWSRSATRTWPVVYAYHGGRDTYVSWTRSTDVEQLAADYGVMVVMPDTGFAGWFTDWRNYGHVTPSAGARAGRTATVGTGSAGAARPARGAPCAPTAALIAGWRPAAGSAHGAAPGRCGAQPAERVQCTPASAPRSARSAWVQSRRPAAPARSAVAWRRGRAASRPVTPYRRSSTRDT
jgi:hypothetical protein